MAEATFTHCPRNGDWDQVSTVYPLDGTFVREGCLTGMVYRAIRLSVRIPAFRHACVRVRAGAPGANNRASARSLTQPAGTLAALTKTCHDNHTRKLPATRPHRDGFANTFATPRFHPSNVAQTTHVAHARDALGAHATGDGRAFGAIDRAADTATTQPDRRSACHRDAHAVGGIGDAGTNNRHHPPRY
jgi:hypothetical protein